MPTSVCEITQFPLVGWTLDSGQRRGSPAQAKAGSWGAQAPPQIRMDRPVAVENGGNIWRYGKKDLILAGCLVPLAEAVRRGSGGDPVEIRRRSSGGIDRPTARNPERARAFDREGSRHAGRPLDETPQVLSALESRSGGERDTRHARSRCLDANQLKPTPGERYPTWVLGKHATAG